MKLSETLRLLLLLRDGHGHWQKGFFGDFLDLGKQANLLSSDIHCGHYIFSQQAGKSGYRHALNLTPSTLSSANYLTVFESDLHSMKGAHNSYETRSYDLVVDNFSI